MTNNTNTNNNTISAAPVGRRASFAMIMEMKTILLGAALFLIAGSAQAYSADLVEPTRPYATIPVTGDPYVEHVFLGDLDGYPEMYELTSEVSFDLKVKLRQRARTAHEPLNITIVRDDTENGGVVEVARLNQPVDKWQEYKDKTVGMTFIESRTMSLSVPPGTYRIEVNTPDNKGNYMLVIGDEPSRDGYFTTLNSIRKTHKQFDSFFLNLLMSPYVYYPLGILLLLGAIYQTRRRHKALMKTYDS